MYVQDNPKVKINSGNDISNSWSFYFMIPMRVLKFILGIGDFYICLQMNEINDVTYIWIKEAYSVFAKEASQVEVSYVEPSFGKS